MNGAVAVSTSIKVWIGKRIIAVRLHGGRMKAVAASTIWCVVMAMTLTVAMIVIAIVVIV